MNYTRRTFGAPDQVTRDLDATEALFWDTDPPDCYKGQKIKTIRFFWNGGRAWSNIATIKTARHEGHVVFGYEPGELVVFDSFNEATDYRARRDLEELEKGRVFPPKHDQYFARLKADRDARKHRRNPWEEVDRARELAKKEGRAPERGTWGRPALNPRKNARGQYYFPRPVPVKNAPRQGDSGK